ncbi:MAG TPA: class A beta-lactamase, subclass A2 [Saprospiraceae bacterium]|nr:class A beta-lactamase, subclass A2 [Saprospiraceae bacterium]HMP23058.1 class A beta-lactamase, subclass A2 [Saprospiraceae bacterium]
MYKFYLPIILIQLLFTIQAYSQNIDSLRNKIEQIILTKNAVVGVAIADHAGENTLTINGERRFPMQSVFKFYIGLAMLSEIDKGNFSLDQKIKIKKNELLPDLWSPIRTKHPKGATLAIAEILEYTVSQSDNVGCDVLLRLLGGPLTVENYIKLNGIEDISIKINEEVMQNNWDLQFDNWTTPQAANQTLEMFFNNSHNLLSQNSYDFIWRIMRATSTGENRLKGKLPKGTIVAHKTGWSGKNKATGITAAVNDIGIIFLPNGKHFFISVFVTDSKEELSTNEEIIADIAKAAWDYFNNATK